MLLLPVRVLVVLLPIMVLMIGLEAVWWRKRARRSAGVPAYAWAESATSLAVTVGHRAVNYLTPLLVLPAYYLAWDWRVVTVPLTTWWGWALLLLVSEFAYYCFHRASHGCRWMWATHMVHHSSTQITLPAAYRLGWTPFFSGQPLFWLPLPFLGFDPAAVVLAIGINLAYQFWLHTEAIGTLGPLEWVLNTPAHHRVHHATNEPYRDRNFGGMVIVFDRLLGTFAAVRADEPLRYGLVEPIPSNNPLVIVFYEWRRLFAEVRRARTWRERLMAAFGAPGRRTATRESRSVPQSA